MKAPYIIVVAMAFALLLPLQQAASVEIETTLKTQRYCPKSILL